MSKDDDFKRLQEHLGVPPQIIWINCGNTSNQRMREILGRHLSLVLKLLEEGNNLVEINEV